MLWGNVPQSQSWWKAEQMRTSTKIAVIAICAVGIGGAVFGWRWYQDRASIAAKVRTVRASAEVGDAESEAKLGSIYLRGRGVPQDYGEALRWYRKAAEQNSANGEVGVGAAYYHGYGVPTDYVESMRWYRRAADQGNAAGETGVAYLYEHGDGVAQDYAEALRWYRKAADQGEKLAEEELGYLYSQGTGVPRDYGQALIWYEKAADQGEAQAQYQLGRLYYYGKGVPADRAKALKLIGKAADGGDQKAQRYLTPNLSTCIKAVLLTQLLLGLFLLSFAPYAFNYLPAVANAWDRDRRVTVVAGMMWVFYDGLKWFGYTHYKLRRYGVPWNAFTAFTWAVGLIAVAAIVYMVRVGRPEARDRSEATAEGIA